MLPDAASHASSQSPPPPLLPLSPLLLLPLRCGAGGLGSDASPHNALVSCRGDMRVEVQPTRAAISATMCGPGSTPSVPTLHATHATCAPLSLASSGRSARRSRRAAVAGGARPPVAGGARPPAAATWVANPRSRRTWRAAAAVGGTASTTDAPEAASTLAARQAVPTPGLASTPEAASTPEEPRAATTAETASPGATGRNHSRDGIPVRGGGVHTTYTRDCLDTRGCLHTRGGVRASDSISASSWGWDNAKKGTLHHHRLAFPAAGTGSAKTGNPNGCPDVVAGRHNAQGSYPSPWDAVAGRRGAWGGYPSSWNAVAGRHGAWGTSPRPRPAAASIAMQRAPRSCSRHHCATGAVHNPLPQRPPQARQQLRVPTLAVPARLAAAAAANGPLPRTCNGAGAIQQLRHICVAPRNVHNTSVAAAALAAAPAVTAAAAAAVAASACDLRQPTQHGARLCGAD
eukprot:364200-Chlamydomonas_euryale.AAC.3